MRLKRILFFIPLFFLIFLEKAMAHCPLCTAGAGAAAAGAVWLGVSKSVVAIFIGAFAVSTGYWASRMLKKKYVPAQHAIFILAAFLLTIIPLMPIIADPHPFYLSFFGDYGSLFNRTYIINLALVGSIIGGLIVSAAPWISGRVKKLRNGKLVPFQGVTITLILLVLTALFMQFAIV